MATMTMTMTRRNNEHYMRCPACMGSHIASPQGDPSVEDIFMCFACGEIALQSHQPPGLRIPTKVERADAEARMQSAQMFWRLIPAASNSTEGQ
jgi:hypothetical protein